MPENETKHEFPIERFLCSAVTIHGETNDQCRGPDGNIDCQAYWLNVQDFFCPERDGDRIIFRPPPGTDGPAFHSALMQRIYGLDGTDADRLLARQDALAKLDVAVVDGDQLEG